MIIVIPCSFNHVIKKLFLLFFCLVSLKALKFMMEFGPIRWIIVLCQLNAGVICCLYLYSNTRNKHGATYTARVL